MLVQLAAFDVQHPFAVRGNLEIPLDFAVDLGPIGIGIVFLQVAVIQPAAVQIEHIAAVFTVLGHQYIVIVRQAGKILRHFKRLVPFALHHALQLAVRIIQHRRFYIAACHAGNHRHQQHNHQHGRRRDNRQDLFRQGLDLCRYLLHRGRSGRRAIGRRRICRTGCCRRHRHTGRHGIFRCRLFPRTNRLTATLTEFAVR